jgi:hypothetical protein
LLIEARWALGVRSQGELGVLLGSSERSGQRWEREEAKPSTAQLRDLAARVFPVKPELAREIATHAGTTLEDLGVAVAVPVPSRPRPRVDLIVDTVVCAAADAMGTTPEAIRPALRAAFRRANAAGFTLDELDDALGGGAREKTARASRPARRGDAPVT